jgi:peptidoglycan/LPS O-acetylase OafA/YrhL
MSVTAQAKAPLDLKPLTALRILPALWVVLADYWPDLKGVPDAPPAFIASGQLGVELFFVLSGFILSHVYLSGFGEKRFNYRGFLWARLARIYPLHIATLAAVGIMGAAALLMGRVMEHNVLYWPSLPSNLLLVNAWGFNTDAGWNHPAWSISAEWFAYLLFPVFATVAWSLRARPILAVGLAGLLLVVIYPTFQHFAGFKLTDATIAWGALRIVPCFAYGCAMFLVWRSNAIRTQRTAVAMSLGFAVFSLLLVALSAPTAAIVASFGALILGLASLTSTGSTLFSGKAGVYLGEVSFAVYMVAIPWKMLIMSGAEKVLHLNGDLPLPIWLVYFGGVVLVGMIGHHLVERPARNLMRKWAEGRIHRPSPAVIALPASAVG